MNCALVERAHRQMNVSACREQDAQHVGANDPDLLEEREPIHARHVEVADDGVDLVLLDEVQALNAVAGLMNDVAWRLQQAIKCRANLRLIVNEKDLKVFRHALIPLAMHPVSVYLRSATAE